MNTFNLDCFQFGAIISKAAMNSQVRILCGHVFIPVDT